MKHDAMTEEHQQSTTTIVFAQEEYQKLEEWTDIIRSTATVAVFGDEHDHREVLVRIIGMTNELTGALHHGRIS